MNGDVTSNRSITIDDVAKAAGVSRATVGRVIGNYGSVSEKSRQKVLKAVDELGYQPNSIAQGLRSHNTKTLAVVLASIKNNFCNALVYSIEKEAMERGYNVLICNTHERLEDEITQLKSIYSKQVNGILMISVCTADQNIPEQFRRLYDGESIPTVFVDRQIKGLKAELFQSTNEQSSYDATKYLISLGHRKIGIIGTKDYSTVRDRILGYKRALREANIPIDESVIVDAEYHLKNAGSRLTAQLLDNHKDITALYVLNNTLCGGVLLELKRRNMQVGEDISLLAWDDEELNELLDITTVEQPVEEIGKQALLRLLEMIQDPASKEQPRIRQIPAQIIIRKSCVPPKHLR